MSGVEKDFVVIEGEGVNLGDGVLEYGVIDLKEEFGEDVTTDGAGLVPLQETNPTVNANQMQNRHRIGNRDLCIL